MTYKKKIFDMGYSVFIFALSLVVLIFLAFQYTSKTVTNEKFFLIYCILGVIGVIGSLISVVFYIFDKKWDNNLEEDVASTMFLSDTNRYRFFSNIYARIIILILLILFVSGTVLLAGSVVPVPNPYSSESISKSILDQHPVFLNLINVAIYPGLFEELPIFVGINGLIFLLAFGISIVFKNPDLRRNMFVVLICALISITAGSALFVFAHSTAYDMNKQAYMSAFIFEWIVQAANQFTGLFISWIPHMLHNAVVVLDQQLAFSIGGSLVGILLFKTDFVKTSGTQWHAKASMIKKDFQTFKEVVKSV